MRTQWTTKGNRDAGSSCLCDRGLHRYLRNFGGGLNTPNPLPGYATGHVTVITESRFGAATWLITQNLKPGKGCVIEKLSSLCSKKNESIVIGKDDRGKLSWDHKYALVLDFLDHGDTVCQVLLWYTLLTAAILCKRPRLLHQRIILLHAYARHHTANWTYSCLWLYIW